MKKNKDSGTHLLSYLKRRVAPPRAHAKSFKPAVALGLLRPAGHAFNDVKLWQRYRNGEDLTVWLFSCLAMDKVTLPPSLDALIRVTEGVDNPRKTDSEYLRYLLKKRVDPNDRSKGYVYDYAFAADTKRSVYLPWVDATPLLFDLEFESNSTPKLPASLREMPSMLPRHFQSSRILTPCSIARISAYAENVIKRDRVFISYRRKDGTATAVAMVKQLSNMGYACWWDRWSMSRSVAEQKSRVRKQVVVTAIESACRNCKLAVIVNSPDYGKEGWTKWEHETLVKLREAGKIKLEYVPCTVS